MQYNEQDEINYENQSLMRKVGYQGDFPITVTMAADWLEEKYPGSVLKKDYRIFRGDLMNSAYEKYPPKSLSEILTPDADFYNRRRYILNLALNELLKTNRKAKINLVEFIGDKAFYDREAQMIFGVRADKGTQLLADVRGWGAIQNLFKNPDETIDLEKASEFQDALGEWLAEAINEKLQREK